jgi:hypothetical protein
LLSGFIEGKAYGDGNVSRRKSPEDAKTQDEKSCNRAIADRRRIIILDVRRGIVYWLLVLG